MNFYKLEKETGNITKTEDVVDWIQWFAVEANRSVARDDVGTVTVSTVFLGLDPTRPDAPRLFETLVMGGAQDGLVRRTRSLEAALSDHRYVVACLETGVAVV